MRAPIPKKRLGVDVRSIGLTFLRDVSPAADLEIDRISHNACRSIGGLRYSESVTIEHDGPGFTTNQPVRPHDMFGLSTHENAPTKR